MSEFPTLYKKDATGKIRFWELKVHHHENESHIITQYGVLNGKRTETKPTIINKGKNIGKSNETTVREQATFEAQQKWNLKIKKEQFSESMPDNTSSEPVSREFRPMLAQKFTPEKSQFNIKYIAQPKLDGVRMNCIIQNNEPVFYSRTGKIIENFELLRKHIKSCNIPNGAILDGELGCFGKNPALTFQEVTGIVKRKKGTPNSNENLIEYVVYDCFYEQQLAFTQRYEKLIEIIGHEQRLIRLCCKDFIVVQSREEIESILDKFLNDGYEGLMLRTYDGKYECDKRSKCLLKYKKFTDAEFEIVGFKEANGNDKNTIIFECKTKDDKTFSVRPAMTHAERSKMFDEARENPNKFIGKQLTVKYFELSPDGIPRFPVGVVVRDYE